MKKITSLLIFLLLASATAYALPTVIWQEGKAVQIPGGELTVPDVKVTDDLTVADDTTVTGDLNLAGTFTYPGTLVWTVATKAAAGADLAGATPITSQITYVTASDGAKGVSLPAGNIGQILVIHNTVAGQNLKLWPPDASGTINGGAGGASVLVAGQETCVIVKVAADTWYGGVGVNF